MRAPAWWRRWSGAEERSGVVAEASRVADAMWTAAGDGDWPLADARHRDLSRLGRRFVELGGDEYGPIHAASVSYEYGSSFRRVTPAARDAAAPGTA